MWTRSQSCGWLRLALLAGAAAAGAGAGAGARTGAVRQDRNEWAPSRSAAPSTTGARADRGGGGGAADTPPLPPPPPSTPLAEHDMNDNKDSSKIRSQHAGQDGNNDTPNLRYVLAKKQAMLNEYLKRKALDVANTRIKENRMSIDKDKLKKSGGVSAAAVQPKDDMTAPPLEAALLRLEGDSEHTAEDDARDLAAQRTLAGLMRRMQDSRPRPPLTASGERRAERALGLIGGYSAPVAPAAPAGPGQGRWLRAALRGRGTRGTQHHPYDDHAWSKEFANDALFGGNKWI